MHFILIGIIAVVALIVLLRLRRRSARTSRPAPNLIGIVTLVLLVAVGLLAATGRLHWLAAVGAALLPLLRHGLVLLLRYVPFLSRLYWAHRQQGRSDRQHQATGTMTREQALAVLELGPNPSRQEIINAHRQLMAKVHPDKGGSTYLAQQLNQAKEELLS